jgi:hypothetical protein
MYSSPVWIFRRSWWLAATYAIGVFDAMMFLQGAENGDDLLPHRPPTHRGADSDVGIDS